MFGILKVKEPEKGMINRFKNLISPPEPILERVNVSGGAPFFELTMVKDRDGNIDYDEVYRILGRCASRLLVPDGFEITQSDRIMLYKPKIFPALVMLNSAIQMIEKYALPPETVTAAIVDRDGLPAQKIIRLVPLAASLKIISPDIGRYDKLCEKVLDEWGLALNVTNNPAEAQKCDFVISPYPQDDSELYGFVSIRDKASGKVTYFTGDSITLPSNLSDIMPQFIDPLVFSSALFELCGVTSIADMRFNRMVIKNQP